MSGGARQQMVDGQFYRSGTAENTHRVSIEQLQHCTEFARHICLHEHSHVGLLFDVGAEPVIVQHLRLDRGARVRSQRAQYAVDGDVGWCGDLCFAPSNTYARHRGR